MIDTKDRFPLKLTALLKLKDCPFCGGVSRVTYDSYELPDFAYSVRCTVCYAKGSPAGDAIQAAKNWNRREKQ